MQNSQHTWWVWRKAGVQCGSCCFRSRPDSGDNLPSPGWTADPDTLGTHNPPSCKSRKKYSYYLPENIFTNIYIYKYIVAIYMYIYNCLERERERERERESEQKEPQLMKKLPTCKPLGFFFQMSFHTHTHTHTYGPLSTLIERIFWKSLSRMFWHSSVNSQRLPWKFSSSHTVILHCPCCSICSRWFMMADCLLSPTTDNIKG